MNNIDNLFIKHTYILLKNIDRKMLRVTLIANTCHTGTF